MPTSRLQIPHQIGIEEAKTRISKFAETARQRPGMITDIEDSWAGDTGKFSFKVMGMSISGNVAVQDDQVQIEVSYPMAALPFKSRIEGDIAARAKEVLGAA